MLTDSLLKGRSSLYELQFRYCLRKDSKFLYNVDVLSHLGSSVVSALQLSVSDEVRCFALLFLSRFEKSSNRDFASCKVLTPSTIVLDVHPVMCVCVCVCLKASHNSIATVKALVRVR